MWLEILSLLSICIAQGTGRADSGRAHSISRQQAKTLVNLALEGTPTLRLRGFGLETVSMPNFPEYYFFEGIWNNPNPGSAVAGHWAVNATTGEVWDPFACVLVKSARLKSELSRWRKKMKISPADVHRAREDKPCL